MPFRYVSGDDKEVSGVGSLPNDQVRSPEDNLRLWQFLTVYWMSPLIRIGKKRKLNEEDVWLLAYEFQHSRLFETFQTLKGSVLGRVIRANGLDIFIISMLSLIDLACSRSFQLIHFVMALTAISVCRSRSPSAASPGNGGSIYFS
jgi:hypothetical protein